MFILKCILMTLVLGKVRFLLPYTYKHSTCAGKGCQCAGRGRQCAGKCRSVQARVVSVQARALCAGKGRQCAGKCHKERTCFRVATWQTIGRVWVPGRRGFHASRGPQGELQMGMDMRYCAWGLWRYYW